MQELETTGSYDIKWKYRKVRKKSSSVSSGGQFKWLTGHVYFYLGRHEQKSENVQPIVL